MIASLYVTLFAIAGAATYLTISRRIDERLGGVITAVMWGRLTAASFNITVYSGGSELTAPADGATAILTGTLTVLMIVFLLGSAFEYVPDRENTRFSKS
jgi:hypothetical protein